MRHAFRAAPAVVVALATATIPARAVAAEPVPFRAFLAPDTSFAPVGAIFTVQFRAGDPAQHFNGYTVKIRFDRTLVAFRSVAEGSLMIAGAPSRFTSWHASDSVVTYTHVLLGAGLFVNGPGELSRFRFEALGDGVSSLDIVSNPRCTFFDDGLCVNDDSTQAFPRTVTLEGAIVVTGNPPLHSPPDAPGSGGTGLRFSPNPTGGAGDLLFDIRAPGAARLVVVDAAGRLVQERAWLAATAGPARWTFRGVDATGAPVASGVYFARLEDAAGARRARFVVLR